MASCFTHPYRECVHSPRGMAPSGWASFSSWRHIMISITGTLSIKAVNGSKGSFCVGDLSTSVGTFKVKDAILDQYSPGDYDGTFVIEEIFPSSYTWRGRSGSKCGPGCRRSMSRANPKRPIPRRCRSRSNPIRRTRIARCKRLPSRPFPTRCRRRRPRPRCSMPKPMDLIEAGKAVKLDPTVDRGLFRAQRDALKGHGYRFDASTQMWELPAE
jgi:hypothetical protein